MIEIREFKIVNDKWLRINVGIKSECAAEDNDGWFIKSIGITTKGKFGNSLSPLTDDIAVNKALWLAIQNDIRYEDNFLPASIDDITNEGVFPISSEIYTDFNIDIDLDGCPCLKDKIFYLKITADKFPNTTKCTTCAYTNYAKCVYVDKKSMYGKIACVAHKIEGCDIPRHFIDYLMRLKALEAAIEVYQQDINDNYSDDVNTYYQELILTPKTNVVFKPCNCRNNG